jgi:hypothetical protein
MPSASVAFTEERFKSVRAAARSPAFTASMRLVALAALRLATTRATRLRAES